MTRLHFLIAVLVPLSLLGVRAENAVITLEQLSPDFKTREEIALSADMVTSDGKIVIRGVPGGSSGFFRLRLVLDRMTEVAGGSLPSNSQLAGTEVATFLISQYETTYREWKFVASWSSSKGYDISTVGYANGDDYPVQAINWYDAVKWCNAKSEMEGLAPAYRLESGQIYRSGEFGSRGSAAVIFNPNANGYRLPTDSEWEWAARGGVLSQNYAYSGSNNPDEVSWHLLNSSNPPSRVGLKQQNELGLHDMSGNVWEWCWDPNGLGARINRGGGFDHQPTLGNVSSRTPFGINMDPTIRYFSWGMRFARNVK